MASSYEKIAEEGAALLHLTTAHAALVAAATMSEIVDGDSSVELARVQCKRIVALLGQSLSDFRAALADLEG